MENKNSSKVILIILLILSLLFGGWLIIKNKSTRTLAAKEKSVLVTEKQLLNTQINELVADKKNLGDLNSTQNKRIEELLNEVEKKNKEIQRLLADNAKVKDLRKKLDDLEQIRIKLKTEIESLKTDLDDAKQANNELEVKVESLKDENERIKAELMIVKSFHTTDFLIEGIKRNQKITAWARRTKEINLSFDFPSAHISEIEVSISTPDGKTYSSANKDFVSIKPSKGITSVYPSGLTAQRMELILKPEKKFVKGIYKFSIFKATEMVATMQLQLK